MTARREDQFIYIVSSDGCKETYPDNVPSNFTIALQAPIELPFDEEWEAGLIDIHYPFSWTNIGPKADTRMKFLVKDHVAEVTFPNWQCTSLTEVIDFIKAELELVTDQYILSLDGLRRFRIESSNNSCDVGFSENLRKLLGLSEHDPTYTYEAISRRAYHRGKIYDFWKNGNPLDTDAILLDEILKNAENPLALATSLKNHLHVENMQNTTQFDAEPELENKAVDESIARIAYELGIFGPSANFRRNFKIFSKHLRFLYQMENFPPKMIQAVKLPQLVPVQQLYIRTNIVQPIDVNDHTENLLKIVNVTGEPGYPTAAIFTPPTYHPLVKGGKISSIRVYITSNTGDLVPFEKGTVMLTLHFRKQRHRR